MEEGGKERWSVQGRGWWGWVELQGTGRQAGVLFPAEHTTCSRLFTPALPVCHILLRAFHMIALMCLHPRDYFKRVTASLTDR